MPPLKRNGTNNQRPTISYPVTEPGKQMKGRTRQMGVCPYCVSTCPLNSAGQDTHVTGGCQALRCHATYYLACDTRREVFIPNPIARQSRVIPNTAWYASRSLVPLRPLPGGRRLAAA